MPLPSGPANVKVLARIDGNSVRAAQLLGISRPTLYVLMGRHTIKPAAGGGA